MTSTPAPLLRRQPTEPRAAVDRRLHKRFQLTLLGRFMRSTKHEYPCKLIDISVGGAAMMSPVGLNVGERIIAYFDHIGGIEGHVVRVFDGGFAMSIIATPHKREKLAAQITWLINKDELSSIEDRRHERFALGNRPSTLVLEDGSEIECQIQDVSLAGASVATAMRPPIGAEATLGKLRCRVVRHHDTGVGVAFADIQEPEALRKYFGRLPEA